AAIAERLIDLLKRYVTSMTLLALRASPQYLARACRRCHEFRTDRVDNVLADDRVNCPLRFIVERPPHRVAEWLELLRTASTPQGRQHTGLIQHPSYGE